MTAARSTSTEPNSVVPLDVFQVWVSHPDMTNGTGSRFLELVPEDIAVRDLVPEARILGHSHVLPPTPDREGRLDSGGETQRPRVAERAVRFHEVTAFLLDESQHVLLAADVSLNGADYPDANVDRQSRPRPDIPHDKPRWSILADRLRPCFDDDQNGPQCPLAAPTSLGDLLKQSSRSSSGTDQQSVVQHGVQPGHAPCVVGPQPQPSTTADRDDEGDEEQEGEPGSHRGRILLSNDQTFCGDTRSGCVGGGSESSGPPPPRTAEARLSEAVRVSGSAQIRFGHDDFEGAKPRRVRRWNYRAQPVRAGQPDHLDQLYEQRAAARLTERSVTTYRWLRKDVLALASARAGRNIGLVDLFADGDLLGHVLVSDRLASGQPCSKSTIAHRRTEVRSVAAVLRPELLQLLGRDPQDVIRDALRSAAERRGSGYRINAGTPRTKGGATPSPEKLRAIIGAMGQSEGWVGLRDRALATLLASTASRVNALRTLDGLDCHVLPGDRVRVLLHQKNGRERHEVELDRESRESFRLYLFAFNEVMRIAERADRIVLGQPGPIWRTERGQQLPDKALRAALRRACRVAGTPDYTPHAFRRAWATAASEMLPRWEGALGGGWRGTERFDASYVTPSRRAAWRKLAGVGLGDSSPPEAERARHEPAPAL